LLIPNLGYSWAPRIGKLNKYGVESPRSLRDANPSLCKGASTLRAHEFNGQAHTFSDQWGERTWLAEPERYECQNIFEQYEGRELSDVIAELHGLRYALDNDYLWIEAKLGEKGRC
jgi:hypothetical protein